MKNGNEIILCNSIGKKKRVSHAFLTARKHPKQKNVAFVGKNKI